jgi:hypothetical protein
MVPKMFIRKPTMGWIVAPTYDLGEKEFRVFWEVLVDKLQVPLDKSKTFNSLRTKDFRITTAWGASVEVRSAEHPDSLVGEGLDWVIMAEAAKLKLSHWEKFIRPTLSDKRGQAVFVSTPEGYNWFYDAFQRGQDERHPTWWSMRSPTWENSIVFPEGARDPEIIEVKNTLATEVFDQEYGALFTSFAGRIYSEFDEGYHVIPESKYEYHPDWPTYLALDFGYRVPWVCLSMQVAPNDDVIVFDEYYEKGQTTVAHARALKEIIKYPVQEVYYDPADPDGAGTVEKEFRDGKSYNNPNLTSCRFVPGPNEWKPGIERVKEWLKLREQDGGDMKPKLYITSNCRRTIHEFNTYRVKEQSEKVSEIRDPKDEPRKKDDHAMDALRYFFTGHFGFESHVAMSY